MQNSNLFEEINKLKENIRLINEESDFFKQESKTYKKHIFNLSQIFDTITESKQNPASQFMEEFRQYLEKNFLDKVSNSFFLEDNKLESDKKRGAFISPVHTNTENLMVASENKGFP